MLSRSDGRAWEQIQPLTIHLDGLARVDGSASFGFGAHAQALASVAGPIEVRLANENPSAMVLEVFVRPVSGVPGTESKALASAVSSAISPSILLTQNPRTLTQLVLQTLSHSTDSHRRNRLLASCINASTLALMNAGSIPMKGVACAVCIGRSHTTDGSVVYLVDPNEREFKTLDASGCFAFIFASGRSDIPKCVWSDWHSATSGANKDAEIVRVDSLARSAAHQVWLALKNFLAPGSGDNDDELEI